MRSLNEEIEFQWERNYKKLSTLCEPRRMFELGFVEGITYGVGRINTNVYSDKEQESTDKGATK